MTGDRLGSLLVLLLVALAGCFGSSKDDARDAAAPTANPSGTDPAAPTDTGTPSRVTIKENATTIGGSHFHDWWAGQSSAIIFDRDIQMGPGGVCVGSLVFSCTGGQQFVRFPPSDPGTQPNNVWPGTGRMEVKVHIEGVVVLPFEIAASYPAGPGGFAPIGVVDKPDVTFVIDGLQENSTDPPHFTTSSWVFRLQVHKGNLPAGTSLYEGRMHWTVTIFRSDRPLPLDPAHPDYWEDRTQILLVENATRVDVKRVDPVGQAPVTSGGLPTIRAPKNSTVLPGTHKMTIEVSWVNENAVGPKIGLRVCDVNGLCGSTNAVWSEPAVSSDTGTKRAYEFEVRDDQWDTPYALASGWAFAYFLDNGDLGPAVGETGAFKGTISLQVTIHKLH